jgi:hypothetical protein
VARAVIETPVGKSHYRARLSNLVTNLLRPDGLTRRVEDLVAALRPSLPSTEFAAIQKEASLLNERITQRRASLDSQLSQTELRPLTFESGSAQLAGWAKSEAPSKGSMDKSSSPDRIASLHILIQSETAASWRTKVLLNRGSYRFEGRARVSGVKPLPFGAHQGAGLRIGGSPRQSQNLVGDASWKPLSAEFQITTDVIEVELVCELRAAAGEVWFDESSLRLVRSP